MPYLIDGHNLIPHLGLSLDAPDDEFELLDLLREFCKQAGKRAEVYFDGAQPGSPATRKLGLVTAHFVRPPQSADDAIAARLRRLGGDAGNWTVVSSDRRVQADGRAAHAKIAPSSAFASQMKETIEIGFQKRPENKDGMSDEELRQWLEIFNKKFK